MSPDKKGYIAEIDGVKEITLICYADISLWIDYLKIYKVCPVEFNGMAKILVISSEMKFLNVNFREFIIAIIVQGLDEHPDPEAAFMLHAFNSNRFFSWSERLFFSTPYGYSKIVFESKDFSSTHVLNNKVKFCLSNTISKGREPVYEGQDCQEGYVYLPGRNKNRDAINWFYANMQGYTLKYDFIVGEDSIKLINRNKYKVFECLSESNLKGSQWIIRSDAHHKKSKTYHSFN